MALEDFIKEVNILHTQENDVLVFKVPVHMINEVGNSIQSFCKSVELHTGRKCMVVPTEFEIEILHDGTQMECTVDHKNRRIIMRKENT